MRRSRHKLEVSTFPFLAVLLCAMGSLIFLLMVMDKRAKIVAQHKIEEKRQEEAEARKSALAMRDAKREAERQADSDSKLAQLSQLAQLARLKAERQAEWDRE